MYLKTKDSKDEWKLMEKNKPYTLRHGDQFSLSGRCYVWEVVDPNNNNNNNNNPNTNDNNKNHSNNDMASSTTEVKEDVFEKTTAERINRNYDILQQSEKDKMKIEFITSHNTEIPPLISFPSNSQTLSGQNEVKEKVDDSKSVSSDFTPHNENESEHTLSPSKQTLSCCSTNTSDHNQTSHNDIQSQVQKTKNSNKNVTGKKNKKDMEDNTTITKTQPKSRRTFNFKFSICFIDWISNSLL
jgi:hypothetical protein